VQNIKLVLNGLFIFQSGPVSKKTAHILYVVNSHYITQIIGYLTNRIFKWANVLIKAINFMQNVS